MAVNASQLSRGNAAINAAQAAVDRRMRETGASAFTLFPSKEQSVALAMSDTLDAIKSVWAGLLDDSTPIVSDAQVDEVVTNARQLSDPGFYSTEVATPTNMRDVLPDAGVLGLGDLSKVVWGMVALGVVYIAWRVTK